jgi:DNA repair photolyase
MDNNYTSPVGVTSQFRFCGNCLRVDLLKGCSFGCEYCFINNSHINNPQNANRNESISKTKIRIFENIFKNAIDENKTNNLINELVSRKTPFHLGGNSDPLQDINLFNSFIELTKKYNYPVIISTKQILSDKELLKCDQNIHAFQISLFTDNEITKNIFEKNTTLVFERIDFIKRLHENGFWVSVRIQPLIYFNEAVSLLNKLSGIINFATIEHIKLQGGNKESFNRVLALLPKLPFVKSGNSVVLLPEYKYQNIMKLKEQFKNIIFGFGDNELHMYSDTLNCCGIDTINQNFKNWLSYNSMVINKGDTTGFIPENKILVFPYIEKTGNCYKEYVDSYVKKYKYYKPDQRLF